MFWRCFSVNKQKTQPGVETRVRRSIWSRRASWQCSWLQDVIVFKLVAVRGGWRRQQALLSVCPRCCMVSLRIVNAATTTSLTLFRPCRRGTWSPTVPQHIFCTVQSTGLSRHKRRLRTSRNVVADAINVTRAKLAHLAAESNLRPSWPRVTPTSPCRSPLVLSVHHTRREWMAWVNNLTSLMDVPTNKRTVLGRCGVTWLFHSPVCNKHLSITLSDGRVHRAIYCQRTETVEHIHTSLRTCIHCEYCPMTGWNSLSSLCVTPLQCLFVYIFFFNRETTCTIGNYKQNRTAKKKNALTAALHINSSKLKT